MAEEEKRIPQVGEVVLGRVLRKLYGEHVFRVIPDRLEEQPRQRGKEARYRIHIALPTTEEYGRLRDEAYRSTAQDVVSDAASTAQELAEEMRSWHDSLPENLQQGEKGSALEEAADNLEDAVSRLEVDWPEGAGEVPVVHIPDLDQSSRSRRCSDAVGAVHSVAEALREHANRLRDEAEDKAAEGPDEEDEKAEEKAQEKLDKAKEEAEDKAAGIEEVADELESAADDLGFVEFPGMY